MLRAFYQSSVIATIFGTLAFGLCVGVMHLLHVPPRVAFAPGVLLCDAFGGVGDSVDIRIAAAGTLVIALCLADAVCLMARKPWKSGT